MKYYLILITTLLTFSFSACKKATSTESLPAKEFAQKITEEEAPLILDVRTPEEFSKGHLENAQNIDFNGADFKTKVANIDKEQAVFVYCLSGGRSASAATQMRADGFKKVYELEGGIMKWRAEKLPETNNETGNTNSTAGITLAQFDALLNEEKLILVDVYADWCGPCQQMKPSLDAIAIEKASQVKLVRIDADKNPELCNSLKIEALPTLLLYRKKKLIWSNVGLVEKEVIETALEGK
jgi:thioredoxin 1